MHKRLLVSLILILAFLAACSNGSENSPTPEEPATPPTEVSESPKEEVEEVEPTEVESGAAGNQPATGIQMECSLVSDQPEAPAELVAIFGVTENDWVKGPDTAAVTFVEYSDFQ